MGMLWKQDCMLAHTNPILPLYICVHVMWARGSECTPEQPCLPTANLPIIQTGLSPQTYTFYGKITPSIPGMTCELV